VLSITQEPSPLLLVVQRPEVDLDRDLTPEGILPRLPDRRESAARQRSPV